MVLRRSLKMSLNVPIIDVHRENFKDFWPAINLAIQTASFIAIDAELSGLGCRRNLMAKSIEDRYKSIAEVAKTRSILSLGLSCFKLQDEEEDQTAGPRTGPKFLAQTFNILTLCNEDYMVEPGALQFLVGHGFDFNKQYSCGVPYCRGPDKKEDKSWPSMRLLFNTILASKKPLTLHNGLVDLVFLYQNLYTNLPPTSAQFIADLYEMYSGGLIDTKYVAEYEARMPASYLEYVFRKSQRENALRKLKGDPHVLIDFCQYSPDMEAVEYQSYLLSANFAEKQNEETAGNKSSVEICEIYAAHGYCTKGLLCPRSHDPDAILDAEAVIVEEKRKRKRRRRNRKNRNQEVDSLDGETDEKKMKDGEVEEEKEKESEMEVCDAAPVEGKLVDPIVDSDSIADLNKANDTEDASQFGHLTNGNTKPKRTEPAPKKTGSHRAGFDAFMTGFATAAFIARFAATEGVGHQQGSAARRMQGGQLTSRVGQLERVESIIDRYGIGQLTNKLYLSGKDYPLAVAKSSFTKTSTLHKDKMDMIIKMMVR